MTKSKHVVIPYYGGFPCYVTAYRSRDRRHAGSQVRQDLREDIPASAQISLKMVIKCLVLGCDNIFVKGQAAGLFRIPIIRENERDFSKKT